jgi:hypothetical protein
MRRPPVWVAFTLCPSSMVWCNPCYGDAPFPTSSSSDWSHLIILKVTLTTVNSSSPPASPSMTYWPNPLTSGKQPSTTPLITSPLSGGSAKGPPCLVALRLGSSVSKLSINTTIATSLCWTILLGKPTPWQMPATVFGIYLTVNSLPILPSTILRVDPGCSVTCASQCVTL